MCDAFGFLMEHVYDGSRIIFDRIRKTVKHGYINCAACLLLTELDHLKKQIHIERDTELITFYLEDNAVMSYCM